MHIGAQPVPASLITRWKKMFPNHQYDTNYGLSESIGPGCVHLGVENIDHVGAIGIPGYGWECKVVDDEGNIVPPTDSERVGELCVKGPGVMICYYKNPEATAECLKDGWLLTGDMAKYDEDGFIWLVDRKKDVIISGGENIYPVQIESFIMKNRKVQDVAVIGTPDARLGEISTAIIQLKDGEEATEEEMNEALKQACADFVFSLPQGIDTVCSESGGGLSEGQAQRIAIARALLRRGSIMLFDEATSALDPDTERQLLQNILEKRDKTVIFITHRPAVVDYCDQTLHIEKI
jgi:acyl-CoA synthetase (AMP-forming)/AMP-acid ligase II